MCPGIRLIYEVHNHLKYRIFKLLQEYCQRTLIRKKYLDKQSSVFRTITSIFKISLDKCTEGNEKFAPSVYKNQQRNLSSKVSSTITM